MNFDERLKKGNELIKNIDLKLGKGVISAILLTSILINPITSHALLDGAERSEKDIQTLVINQSKTQNSSINMTRTEIQKMSLENIINLVEKSINLKTMFSEYGVQDGIERNDIFNGLEKLERNLMELAKISISNRYIKGDFNAVYNLLKMTPQKIENILSSYVKQSLETKNIDSLNKVKQNIDKEVNNSYNVLKRSLNQMVDMELKGEKTGISVGQLNDLIYLLKQNYQNESFVGKKRVENNNKIDKEVIKMEKIKNNVENRSILDTYKNGRRTQTTSLN